MTTDRPTTARVLTAEGRGAVAVVSVAGPRALEVVDRPFVPFRARPFRKSRLQEPRLGRFGGDLGDEVVAIWVQDDPPVVEIHCHGGVAAVRSVLKELEAQGVPRVSQETDFDTSEESFWAQRALRMLPDAPTLRVAEILLDQAQGALDRELRSIREDLRLGHRADAAFRIDLLVERASYGLRLIHGWNVALAGRPNVGKSRLLNRLAGYSRAIVSDEAGTTRDVLSVTAAMDGWPIRFLDMAGLRSSSDHLESLGIAKAQEELRKADLVVVVLDLSHPLTQEDHHVMESYPAALRVANKVDLPPAWSAEEIGALAVSAEEGTGLPGLCEAIIPRLIPCSHSSGKPVPFSEEVIQLLDSFRDEVRRGKWSGETLP